MPRYTISYSFDDVVTGDEDAIRKAIRDLSFSSGFNPMDLNALRVSPLQDEDGNLNGQFELVAPRTLSVTIPHGSERTALRSFLFDMALPDRIDVNRITIQTIDDEPTQLSLAVGG